MNQYRNSSSPNSNNQRSGSVQRESSIDGEAAAVGTFCLLTPVFCLLHLQK
jgi:hypothetical protein